jgi:hypothetical protein
MPIIPFSEDQLRTLINIEQHYEVWIDAVRRAGALPYGMVWKTVNDTDYLYERLDRAGNAKSLGRRSPETEKIHHEYVLRKAELRDREEKSSARLSETARIYRALRLPMIPTQAAKVLREADRRELLGTHLYVVGTNAIPAYSVEAGGRLLDVPQETDDFDLAWIARSSGEGGKPVWSMLKAVDPTYSVNTERSFQARNASAYEVELVVAPSRADGMARGDMPSPIPMEEQEWLLNGTPVSRVVIGMDRMAARIVAPDPRWFALHKLWMANKERRNPLKKPKDAAQGMELLNIIHEAMPHYPLDDEFAAELPEALSPHFAAWKAMIEAAPQTRRPG